MTPRILSSTCLVVAILAAMSVARAQSPSISPFMPPPGTAVARTQGAPIEFRGFMESAEGLRFRIYDPSRKSGSWVKLNERDSTLDVVAKQFDGTPDSESLVVEYQGRTMKLAQRQGKVVSSGAAVANMPPPPVPQPASNVPPAVTQSVVVNPTPADEARRLDAVAQEVARRRALREQAAQGLQPAATPQPQPQPPQQQPPGARRPNNGQRR